MKAFAKSWKAICIIPARYGSTRFPGKPLCEIAGQTLIERVYRQVMKAKRVSSIYVATDDQRIADEVDRFGGQAIMTSPHHQSGTDRIAEASENLDFDIVVNIQGDEPLIPPSLVDSLIGLFDHAYDFKVATAAYVTNNLNLVSTPDSVKVVVDNNLNALYFSRAMIPALPTNFDLVVSRKSFGWKGYFKHIGIYVFTREALDEFVGLKQSMLEQIERLEQLRMIENGMKIRVMLTDYAPVSVDVPADIERVIKALKVKI
ncbi:MAG: 3-deoxy-manno-octulosonate cytidylyltransferase [candidate division Zixibacteria bacterium CG_4_9_14_3_um_filter_46_8]|nr:MAG: 3-deoxy-manno-octulosonate cytidylyltransferase [candidate division Zixibacteria bacterium CG_4_9_14_3_um_filter_46_8]